MPTTNGSRKLRWFEARITAPSGTCSRPILCMRKKTSRNGLRIARVSLSTTGCTPRVRVRSWWTERPEDAEGESLMPPSDLLLRRSRVTLGVVKLHRSVGGAIAGGVAATVWAAPQPRDKRLLEPAYADVELLGKPVPAT